MAKLNTNAAISWTDTGTGTERVLLLDVPLRALRPGFSQTAFSAESLDKTAITSITVGSGAYDLVGMVRYEDDPYGLIDMLQAGATNTTLTYLPNLADPDHNYAVKLISPRSIDPILADIDSQRGTFGEYQIELRFRKTDQSAFPSLVEGTPVLFSYRAGDSLAAATFTRADTATYASKGFGTSTSASTGKARIHWVDTDGDGVRETPTLFLEATSTNLVVQSENLSATWTTVGTIALTSAQSDPAGGTSAYLVADNDAVVQSYITLTPTFTTTGVSKAFSVFLKMGTSLAASGSDIQVRDTTAGADVLLGNVTWSTAGVPTVTMTTGTNIGTVRYTGGWYRFLFRTTAMTTANTNVVRIVPASTAAQTGNIYVYGVQAENALNPTSYIPTAGSTDARTADALTFPFTARPQTMTVYLRYIQHGTLPYSSGTGGIFGIGTNASGSRFEIRNTGGAATISAVGPNASGTVTPGATNGQVVELVAWFRYTASTRTATVQIQAAVAGTAGTAGSVSAASLQNDTFGSTTLYLAAGAGGSSNVTFIPFTHVLVMRGVQDINTMRRVSGVNP